MQKRFIIFWFFFLLLSKSMAGTFMNLHPKVRAKTPSSNSGHRLRSKPGNVGVHNPENEISYGAINQGNIDCRDERNKAKCQAMHENHKYQRGCEEANKCRHDPKGKTKKPAVI